MKLTLEKQLWLKENSIKFTSKELADTLNVSVSLICQFCSKNNLKYTSQDKERFWTSEERQLLLQYAEIRTISELVEIFNHTRTAHSIRGYCGKHNIPFIDGHTNRLVNHNFLDIIDTPEKAYFLGWFITDGHLDLKKNRIEFGLTDKDSLELFNKVLGCEQTIRIAKQVSNNHKQLYKWGVSSPNLSRRLQELGYNSNKTFTVKYPKIPSEFDLHCMRGILDGDGSLYINKQFGHKPLLVFNLVGTFELITECQNKFGFNNKIHKAGNVFTTAISGTKAIEILTKVYQNSKGLRLNRKYEIFTNYLKSRNLLTPELELYFNS